MFEHLDPAAIVALYDKLCVGIYILDSEGTILFVNDTMVTMTGIPRDKMIGYSIFTRRNFQPSATELVQNKKQTVSLYQTIKAQERTYRQLITSIPVFDEHGEIKYIIAVNEELSSLTRRMGSAAALDQSRLELSIPPDVDGEEEEPGKELVARSPQMRAIVQLMRRIADVEASVLIEGESGTGKEVIATTLHKSGARADKKMVEINCAALPEQLLEAELFGYVKGAFTGAAPGGKPGLIQEADGGILFLDEINSLPMSIQGKLLRVLETKRVRRLGAVEETEVDFRLIAAANRSLQKLCAEGRFREDLYYRLNVIPIRVPPLRERREDILPLADQFLKEFRKLYGRAPRVSPEVERQLEAYSWPGNVRELRNLVERMVVSGEYGAEEIHRIPEEMFGAARQEPAERSLPSVIVLDQRGPEENALPGEEFSLESYMNATEERLLRGLAEKCRTVSEMAAVLKIDRTNVGRKLKRYGITLRK